MKISMPITKKRIETHFHYLWWLYVLVAAVALLGWNLVGTVTRYQSPPELKVEWYYGGYMYDQGEVAEALMAQLNEQLLPDMEEVTFRPIVMDDAYGAMQLSTWSFAGEGDLYTLDRTNFGNMARNGTMLNLQPYVDSGVLNLDGIDLTGCYATITELGEEWLCGIPMDAMPGLLAYNLAGEDHVISVLINGGNNDNTIKLLAWMLENCREPVELPPAAMEQGR